ncbi:acyltransferase, partial [bacterium]
FSFGRLGTLLLFIVAGFLMPASVARRASTGALLRDRAVRFYTLSTLVLVAMLVVYAVQGVPFSHSPIDLVANFLMIARYAHRPEMNPITWTMPILLLCLAIGSIALRAAKGNGDRYFPIAMAKAVAVAVVFGGLPFFITGRVPGAVALFLCAFGIGIALELGAQGRLSHAKTWTLVGTLVASAALSAWVNYALFQKASGWDRHSVAAVFLPFVGAVIVAMAVRHRGSIVTPRIDRFLSPIGKAGFSLYLTHTFSILLIPAPAGNVGAFILRMIVSVAVALAVHRYVEQPVAGWIDARLRDLGRGWRRLTLRTA